MTRCQLRLAGLAVVLVAVQYPPAAAQTPESIAARHVRPSPIRVGRLVSAPVMDDVGSFAALPDSVNVIGVVQNDAGVLVPNAGTVVVRELEHGAVAGRATVDQAARFSLRGLPPGLYTSELVSPGGTVLTTTSAFSALRGEVVQIAHTIPSPLARGLLKGVESATSAALAIAASSGVLAIAPGAPVTPGS